MSQSRNESVDTFRMLAALCVIIVHIEFLNVPRIIVVAAKLMSYWVIPFFFVVSGYYLAEKFERTKSLDVQSLMERMGWIFLVWIVLYLPLEIKRNYLGFLSVFDMVTTPIFLYHGDFYHLWYLSSMLIGCLFIAVCYRYNAKILIPIVSIIAIAASIVASGYQILPHDFELGTAIPKYWRSIPLLYMGFFIYRKGVPAWWVSALLIIFGTALLPLEVKFVSWQYGHPAYQELLIGTIPVGVGMACLALNNLSFLQHPLLARWGRDYSLGIYLIHPIIINLIGYIPFLVSSAIFILRNMIWQMLSPVAFLFLCIAALSAIRWYLPAVYNAMFGIRTSPQQN